MNRKRPLEVESVETANKKQKAENLSSAPSPTKKTYVQNSRYDDQSQLVEQNRPAATLVDDQCHLHTETAGEQLTPEQLAMIERNRQAALKRREEYLKRLAAQHTQKLTQQKISSAQRVQPTSPIMKQSNSSPSSPSSPHLKNKPKSDTKSKLITSYFSPMSQSSLQSQLSPSPTTPMDSNASSTSSSFSSSFPFTSKSQSTTSPQDLNFLANSQATQTLEEQLNTSQTSSPMNSQTVPRCNSPSTIPLSKFQKAEEINSFDVTQQISNETTLKKFSNETQNSAVDEVLNSPSQKQISKQQLQMRVQSNSDVAKTKISLLSPTQSHSQITASLTERFAHIRNQNYSPHVTIHAKDNQQQDNVEDQSAKKQSTRDKLQQLTYDLTLNEDSDTQEERRLKKKSKILQNEEEERRPEWLRNPRDKYGRKPSDPDYDPTTLYIPADELKKLSAAKQQYWNFKKERFDEIIFFQQGDFYNLFGPDADIGCEQLGLLYNERLMSVGVNRRDYKEWARKFAALGYKVTRIDQETTATTEEEQATKKSMRKKKTEDRRIADRLTAGTIRDPELLSDYTPQYLLVVKEEIKGDLSNFGICFVDVSTNEFGLASFLDDERCTQFETLLLQLRPKEILHEKGALSPRSKKLLSLVLGKVCMTARQFPDPLRTEDLIITGNYFPATWPEALQRIRTNPLLMSAVGAAISYFDELGFVKEIIPVANYFEYDVLSQTKYLILDSVTLSNLEILQNNDNLSTEGSLLHTLNYCLTAFGKRLLKKWICHPLRNIDEINERLNCVEFFIRRDDVRERLRNYLKNISDLEREIARVQACKIDLYSFLNFIDCLELVQQMMNEIRELCAHDQHLESKLLRQLIVGFPDLNDFFSIYNFDRIRAREQGQITPEPGTMPLYDEAVANVNNVLSLLDDYLKEQQKTLGIPLDYHFSKSENYTIKVNISSIDRIPSDWTLLKKTKTEARYENMYVKNLRGKLETAKDELNTICSNLLLDYLRRFETVASSCKKAIDYLAQLDVLLSLSTYATQLENACRPEFISDKETRTNDRDGAMLQIKGMRHPYAKPQAGHVFVPNDITLGGGRPKMMLITGPNMGGKSTLLRQVCILVIMAQIGSYVPAESCILTVADRIFTRVGARDNIYGGLSTFMIELEETSKMLKYATNQSIIILDELGRGTSTFDGYAIAFAVLKHLETMDCRVLFSTHYHKLTDEFNNNSSQQQKSWGTHPKVALGHMACKEEGGQMTFLYRLSPGACPKSYGMHVAAMADIPSEVICRAEEMSSQFENVIFQRMNKQRQKKEKLFENILKICNNPLSNLSALLSVWRECQTLAK